MTLINEEKERAEVERNGTSGMPQANSYGVYGSSSNAAGFSGTGGVSAQQTQQMQL